MVGWSSFFSLSLWSVFVFLSWCGSVEAATQQQHQKNRDFLCMSVDCIETYCGGIGELLNPLQWPQLRKKRRHLTFLLFLLAAIPIPFPFLVKLLLLPKLSFQPMPSRIGVSPPGTVTTICAPRRSPLPRRWFPNLPLILLLPKVYFYISLCIWIRCCLFTSCFAKFEVLYCIGLFLLVFSFLSMDSYESVGNVSFLFFLKKEIWIFSIVLNSWLIFALRLFSGTPFLGWIFTCRPVIFSCFILTLSRKITVLIIKIIIKNQIIGTMNIV